MQIQKIDVKSAMTKSNLPVADYSVNPYVGCSHACKYCYASFMESAKGMLHHSTNIWLSCIYIINFSGIPILFLPPQVLSSASRPGGGFRESVPRMFCAEVADCGKKGPNSCIDRWE